ncbi:unnamed protein product [Lactuca saligna]|uniref:Glyceraldehyde 3-phosphate dehydrogenase NAD(P) binding domain-containing protein n=1 Tax=Lactuca saligna TaxID=75948 RepID=A0AA36A2N5_LACSI|nr:unnamed protein product [Lactuca saligna]
MSTFRDDIEVVAVNDPFIDSKYMAYVLKYVSTHGLFKGTIKVIDESTLEINGKQIKVTNQRGDFRADYVQRSNHKKGGATKVVISTPSADAPMFVVGVNETTYKQTWILYSMPAVQVVHEEFGIIEVPDTLLQIQKEDGTSKEYSLGAALEATKHTLIQGSTKLLLDFHVVLDQELGLILKLRDMMIGWIHEGFQSFLRQLNDELLKQEGSPL